MTYQIQRYTCRLVRDGQITLPHRKADCVENAAAIFMSELAALPHEELHVIYVNAATDVLGVAKLSQGGTTGCGVTCKEVLRGALIANASAIILGHNHPSGDPTPSGDDRTLTVSVAAACAIVGLSLLDHVVVCPERGTWRSILPENCR